VSWCSTKFFPRQNATKARASTYVPVNAISAEVILQGLHCLKSKKRKQERDQLKSSELVMNGEGT
jgi:hypothetical protein